MGLSTANGSAAPSGGRLTTGSSGASPRATSATAASRSSLSSTEPRQRSGVFTAGISEGLGDIPFPRLEQPRARFYFTEAGWERYGRHVYTAARARGHAIRVIRRKNPARSQIVYQDDYQVAILPRR